MRFLLDTHAFLDLAEHGSGTFSAAARKAFASANNDLLLSAVSINEIAIKNAMQKISVTAADVDDAIEDLKLVTIAFEPHHAMKLFDIPLHHRDPFDRMLIATALAEDVSLVSRDASFKTYRGLRIVK